MVSLVTGPLNNVTDAGESKDEQFRILREGMVKYQISDASDFRVPVKDKKVLEAMLAIPRHKFVPTGAISAAYDDHPIPIGHGQTISQPYIVALMTELLQVSPDHKVLEVGTGSGYQAAVLSPIVKKVYTVEIVKALAEQAKDRLQRLGYKNVTVKNADGFFGWEEHAPFDRIIVTAASTLIPPPLIKQLKPGGKICIPVGGAYAIQYLTMVEKSADNKITMKKVLPVRFVPLTRKLR